MTDITLHFKSVAVITTLDRMVRWEPGAAERLQKAADCIEQALDRVIKDPERRTRDLGGALGTRAFAEHVAKALGAGQPDDE